MSARDAFAGNATCQALVESPAEPDSQAFLSGAMHVSEATLLLLDQCTCQPHTTLCPLSVTEDLPSQACCPAKPVAQPSLSQLLPNKIVSYNKIITILNSYILSSYYTIVYGRNPSQSTRLKSPCFLSVALCPPHSDRDKVL